MKTKLPVGQPLLFFLLFVTFLLSTEGAQAQSVVIAQQGAESGDCWQFLPLAGAGSVVTIQSQNPKTGQNSLRVGGTAATGTVGAAAALTFAEVNVAPFQNLQFSISLRTDNPAVSQGSGLDGGENLVIETNLNGGGWNTAATIAGGQDYGFDWATATAGYTPCCTTGVYNGACGVCNAGACGACTGGAAANPFVINLPTGAQTFQARVRLTDANGQDLGFNHINEFYFIDDARLTGTPVTPLNVVLTQTPNPVCADSAKNFIATNNGQPFPDFYHFSWQINGNNFEGVDFDKPTFNFLPTDPLSDNDVMTVLVKLCNQTVATASATVHILPFTEANAGPERTVCGKDTVIMAANPAGAGGVGEWSQISGPAATIDDVNNPATAVRNLLPNQTYVFRWALVEGNCQPSFSVAPIHVGTASLAQAGADTALCGRYLTLSANEPGVGEMGTWTKVSGPGTPVFNGNSVTVDAAGTYVFRWTVGSPAAPACAATDDVVVQLNGLFAPANAGVDTVTCGVNYTLNANPPAAGETGTWTVVTSDGPVQFAPDNKTNNAKITVQNSGIYILRWTLDNGLCNSKDLTTIDIDVTRTDCLSGLAPLSPTERELLAYPNPAKDRVQFRFTLTAPLDVALRVYQPDGRLCFAQTQTLSAGAQTLDWNLTHANGTPLPAGLYYFTLQTPDSQQQGRLLISK